MMLRFFALLILSVFLCAPACAEDTGLALSVTSPVNGFADNVITAEIPFGGVLTFTLADDMNTYRTWRTQELLPGTNTVVWDGLGAFEEPLLKGNYTLRASLAGAEGTAETQVQITVGSTRQALLYALPERDTLFAGENWAVEVHLVRKGAVVMELRSADAPGEVLYTRKQGVTEDVARFLWNGKDGSKRMPDGAYVARFFAEDLPGRFVDCPLTITSEPRPVEPVTVGPMAMPASDATDAEIWAAMQQPSVVLDVARSSHQKVYAEPDSRSEVLGEFHGQSQGLAVLELQGKWAKVGAWNHEDASYVEGYVPQEKLTVVRPNPHWGILVDKAAQTLSVFRDGERIGTMRISTGLPEKGNLWQETSAGVFLTVDHMDTFADDGWRYAYPIRFDGGNLIHELGYRMNGGRRDFAPHQRLLGSKASHGCVRMPALTGEDGLSAYWLWTHIPRYTRLIVTDDPHERLADNLFAQAGKVYDPDALDRIATPDGLREDQVEIVLTLGGDVVLGTRESWWRKPEALPAALEANGLGYPFRNLQQVFAADDMTLINLECVLKENKAGERTDKAYRFRGLPAWAQALPMASIEQVNIANNHYIDYNEAGRESTRLALTEAGVAFSGYGYTHVAEIAGHRIGFAGIRETEWLKDPGQPERDIGALREQGCEVIIYSCHWGKEYAAAHNDTQLMMAEAITRAGADVIVGTHPHVVQGLDYMDGTAIIYSLGNLMFGGTHDMTTFDGMLARVGLRFGDDGYEGCTVTLIPVLTSSSAPENDFCPAPAKDDDAERILMKVQADTPFLLEDVMWFPCQ